MSIKQLLKSNDLSLKILVLGFALAMIARGLGLFFIPLQAFLIACHEFFHALAAWLTGGSVKLIEYGFWHGTTWSSGGFRPIISAAGYLGCSLFGALIIRFSHLNHTKYVVQCFCLILISSMLIKGQWSLAFVNNLIISAGLIFVLKKWHTPLIMAFLGSLFLSMSFDDIGTFLFKIPYQTDAGILARHLGYNGLTLPIAVIFAVISLSIWAWALWAVSKEIRKQTTKL